ncbi:hypothetical protein SKAU_G00226330 [Synaphobranchus kaupii]|uniref:Uncharacterized protein n=1 Tax=Synaphobranchus kaupii TaxID=118154 RepID=A0A9Q1F4Q7_SYNKA|nr:hypothetical protein SKAU_G00226330 [Synaphobranchus kaupii]
MLQSPVVGPREQRAGAAVEGLQPTAQAAPGDPGSCGPEGSFSAKPDMCRLLPRIVFGVFDVLPPLTVQSAHR